jgi:hypothetical protein
MTHINHQLRNILKCDFVEKVIISNHNPEIKLDFLIKVSDERVTIINHNVRKGCGHRWLVAIAYSPEYMIIIDDDLLVFPWQLRQLFEALVANPEIPHGFAGMVHHENGFLEYRERKDQLVDYICEIYAVTKVHLKRYEVLKERLLHINPSLNKTIDFMTDFIVISTMEGQKPKIHNAGRLFRCPTYNQADVAVHKDHEFSEAIFKTVSALSNLVGDWDCQ